MRRAAVKTQAMRAERVNPIIIIPARLGASRLPGKPLADIGGRPLIERVLRRALAANAGPVVIAAGDQAIVDRVSALGARAVLTDPALPSGSDRVLAALEAVDPEGAHDVVVNLQGDIPFFDPRMIGDALDLLVREPACDIATAVVREASPADRVNPDLPKAVLAERVPGAGGRALYFTRSTLWGEGPVWRHVGLYAYRRAALTAFTKAPPSPLELREKLEQLRALELGMQIWACVLSTAPVEVNTPEDLEVARLHARESADD